MDELVEGRDGPDSAQKLQKSERMFKPYSLMTWQERRALESRDKERELTEQAKRGRRRRNHGGREQPPPAPRNLTQAIVAQHSPPAPEEPERDFLSDSFNSGGLLSPTQGHPEDDFEKAFESTIYDDLKHKSRADLIEELRRRDRQVEELRSLIRSAREAHSEPSVALAQTTASLDDRPGVEAARGGDAHLLQPTAQRIDHVTSTALSDDQ
jgi:hypothetical protein